jgi:hypothetical protein
VAYELFQNKAARFSAPQITVRSGRIAFNADAGDLWEEHGTGTVFAHLLWDAGTCRLGIRPVPEEDQYTFRVSAPKGKRAKTIAALSFLNYIHLDPKATVVADVRWNATEKVIEAELPRDLVGASAEKF